MRTRAAARLLVAIALVATAPSTRAQDDGWDDGGERGRFDGYDVQVDADASPVTLETFQSGLSPYGDWVRSGDHGTAWRPRVASDWRPYYFGRWEWTNEGWLWVSEEPFGWATYHYGRWAFDRGQGWLWVPGFQWAPAWVSWRFGGDVVGWAPLAPGLSLYVTTYAFVDFWWTFVPSVRFCGTPVWGSAYPRSRAYQFYGATAPAPPRARPPSMGWSDRGGGARRPPPSVRPAPAWGGPPPRYIEERTGRAVSASRIVPAARPGAGRGRVGEIGVYRPEIAPRQLAPAHTGRAGRPTTPYPAPPSSGSSRGPPPPSASSPPPARGHWERNAAPAARPEGRAAPMPPAMGGSRGGAPPHQDSVRPAGGERGRSDGPGRRQERAPLRTR